MKKNGSFIISLDFELIWGVFDTVDLRKKEQYFLNTRKVIPQVLSLFEEYNIHATWASVGMLFNNDWTEWQKNIPVGKPQYVSNSLSSYSYVKKINKTGNLDLFFAPEIIREINNCHGQEIATHTYSHYYCLEQGQDLESFKQDLSIALRLAKESGIEITSLVFPRNQINSEYLKVCADLGINNVRSNPDTWYWEDTNKDGLKTKIVRTADAYLPLGKKTYAYSDLIPLTGLPLKQKASRFFRPVESNSLLRKLKINRIKKEMEYAARNGEIYHLWWHPHNFGEKPKESIKDLKVLIHHFVELRSKFGIQSLNMMELGNIIN